MLAAAHAARRSLASKSFIRRASFIPRPVETREVDIARGVDAQLGRDILASQVPLHLVPQQQSSARDVAPARPPSFIDTLLADPAAKGCVVDLEVGRYDEEDVEKVQLPLMAYLEWLKDGREGGKMRGRQVYLAQWRGLEDLPSLRRLLDPPAFLQEAVTERAADFYQASFFIGGHGAITPLHYDPYANLFRMAGTSGETTAKHFLILPPTAKITSYVKRPTEDLSVLRNTSPVDFELDGDIPSGTVTGVSVTQGSPSQSYVDVFAQEALSVTLRQGEMLFLPERYWHRVQNVGDVAGWSAGVGYWFLRR